MVIDFHTHIFPDKIAAKTIESLGAIAGVNAATDGTLNGLIDSMQKSGVDKSVIMPVCTKSEQFDSINLFAKKVNNTYESKLISFGGIHPDCENPKEKLKYIKSLGIPGIKLHPDYQRMMIDDIRFMRIIEYANELGLFWKILKKHGADRILFATDSPWSNAKIGIEYIKNLPINEEEKKQILSENAMRLLKL